MSEMKVSIKCLVYNHALCLRECLDGFVKQKTDFNFEAIVHDDASTDESAAIIREYAEKYPNIIKPIYQTENQYSKDDGSLNRAIEPKLKGKYIAICEGDDVWLDEYKLQKQVDILESNPDYSLVLTNGMYGTSANDGCAKTINPYGPGRESGLLSGSEVITELGGLVPTASMCGKREYLIGSRPSFMYPYRVGDRPMRMWALLNGPIYYIAEPCVFYRIGIADSFGKRIRKNPEMAKKVASSFIDYLKKFNEFTEYKFDREIKYAIARESLSYYSRIGKRIKFLWRGKPLNYFRMRPRPLREFLGYLYHCFR